MVPPSLPKSNHLTVRCLEPSIEPEQSIEKYRCILLAPGKLFVNQLATQDTQLLGSLNLLG